MGVCTQITLYYTSYRLVTHLKVSDIFYLTVICTCINFGFQLFLLFGPEMSPSFMFYSFTLFRLLTLLWFGCCNHCILAYFLCCKKPEHSSSNHGLCCFSSCRPRLSLAEVLMFSLIYVLVITEVLQSWKPVCNLKLILFPNLQLM